MKYFSNKCENIDHLLPGEIVESNFQITIKLAADSENAWKKAIKMKYKSVIIGSQKTTTHLNMEGAQGTRHVVYWNYTNEDGGGAQPLKVNLLVYENHVLQVRSTHHVVFVLKSIILFGLANQITTSLVSLP